MLKDSEIRDLQAKGKRPRVKDRVQLLPLNSEAAEALALLLPNCRADGTGLFKLDIPSFEFISRVYDHIDVRNNLEKVHAVYDDLNAPIVAGRKARHKEKEAAH